MTRKILVASGAALILAFASTNLSARPGGGHGGGPHMGGPHIGGSFARFSHGGPSHMPGRSLSGRMIASDHGRHWDRHGRRFFAGGPYFGGYYYDGGYDGYYDGGYSDCGWLYRQAIRTGSPYWWQRYEICAG